MGFRLGAKTAPGDRARMRRASRRWARIAGLIVGLAALLALPGLAVAEDHEPELPSCPVGPDNAEIAAADPEEREPLRLRQSVAALCAVVDHHGLAAVDQHEESLSALETIDSTLAGGLEVAATVANDPTVHLAEGSVVEVANPADSSEVVQATSAVTDTLHADFWALMGFLAGGALLVAIFKVVRP